MTSLNATRLFESVACFQPYTDILVDISAMPKALYLPLIHKLLHILNVNGAPNLHVLVSEDADIDTCIRDEEIDEGAAYLHSFGGIDLVSSETMPKVWIPVLGEFEDAQLNKIRNFIQPDQVCPLLPFPSKNPRRGDDIILNYQRELKIESGNIIYADEQNPFQVYRQISNTFWRYKSSLKELGGCKLILSAHSSKLLSLGVLLAAYDMKMKKELVGIVHIESHGHNIEPQIENAMKQRNIELFHLWLLGESYEK